MKFKQKFRKVMATLLSVAMVMTLFVGLDLGAITVKAIDYNIGVNDGFSIASDGGVTAQFTINKELDSGSMRGWLICLLENEPSVNSSTNKLTNSGDLHPYSYSNCAYYFFTPDSTNVKGTRTATWSGATTDEKNSGKTLAQVIKEQDWHIVIGPRFYHTNWGNDGKGAGADDLWENCDYYVGPASEAIDGFNDSPDVPTVNTIDTVEVNVTVPDDFKVGTGIKDVSQATVTIGNGNYTYSANHWSIKLTNENKEELGLTDMYELVMSEYGGWAIEYDPATYTLNEKDTYGVTVILKANDGYKFDKDNLPTVSTSSNSNFVLYGSEQYIYVIIEVSKPSESTGEEETTYDVTLDCTNYTETRVDLYTYDSEGNNHEYTYTNGETITVPESGFARVFVYGGEFTVTAEGATVSEIINANDEGYYCEITNFTNDTTVVVGSVHKHNWSAEWTTNATHHWHECTNEGCDIEATAEMDSYAEHTFGDWEVTKNATYLEPGEKVRECTVCKYTETEEVEYVHEHNWSAEWTPNATHHWHECTNEGCDIEATEDMDGYAEHTFGDWEVTKNATYLEPGEKVRECTVCKYTETEEVEYVHEHNWSAEWTTNETHHWHECTNEGCGIETAAEMGGYAEHTFGDWVITKAATATADGEKERTCTVCVKKETAVVKYIPEENEETDTGSLGNITKPEDNACNADMNIDNNKDIVEKIGLDEDEITAIENGADIDVFLTVNDVEISENDKHIAENTLTDNMQIGLYLDIDLTKRITPIGGTPTETAIKETKQPITITFVMPDKLINTDASKTRTYKIIRVHNGVATVLACSFNSATKKASFETDKFSSYAIAYVDTIDNSGNTTPVVRPNYPTVVIKPTVPEKDDDKDNNYEGEDISAAASVELEETVLEIGSASESDVTVYITFTMFTLSVAYAIFKKKKHE